MIITIDTTKDNKSDIRAAINALQQLMNEAPSSDPVQTQEISETASTAFGSMFGDNSPTPTITEDSDKDDDLPKMEMY